MNGMLPAGSAFWQPEDAPTLACAAGATTSTSTRDERIRDLMRGAVGKIAIHNPLVNERGVGVGHSCGVLNCKCPHVSSNAAYQCLKIHRARSRNGSLQRKPRLLALRSCVTKKVGKRECITHVPYLYTAPTSNKPHGAPQFWQRHASTIWVPIDGWKVRQTSRTPQCETGRLPFWEFHSFGDQGPTTKWHALQTRALAPDRRALAPWALAPDTRGWASDFREERAAGEAIWRTFGSVAPPPPNGYGSWRAVIASEKEKWVAAQAESVCPCVACLKVPSMERNRARFPQAPFSPYKRVPTASMERHGWLENHIFQPAGDLHRLFREDSDEESIARWVDEDEESHAGGDVCWTGERVYEDDDAVCTHLLREALRAEKRMIKRGEPNFPHHLHPRFPHHLG